MRRQTCSDDEYYIMDQLSICNLNNHTLTVAVKNMFPKENAIHFSYLCPVTYLISNPTIHVERQSKSLNHMFQLRVALELSLYPGSGRLVQKEIEDTIRHYKEAVKNSNVTSYDILNLLMTLSLSENDHFAESLIREIDITRVWIVQHLKGTKAFAYLKKHLDKWNTPSMTFMPCRSFCADNFIFYKPKYHVDVFKIQHYEEYSD